MKKINDYIERKGDKKMYKTVVIDYSPKADNMAQKVEEKANEMLENGYELVYNVNYRNGKSNFSI